MITKVENLQETPPVRLLPYDVEVLENPYCHKDDERWIRVNVIGTYQTYSNVYCNYKPYSIVPLDSGFSFERDRKIIKLSFKGEGRTWRKVINEL